MPFFWSYLSHFILDFDGVKSKLGLLNPCNLSNYLAIPPASLPQMPLLAIIFLVISQPLQVKFWRIPVWAELGQVQPQLVLTFWHFWQSIFSKWGKGSVWATKGCQTLCKGCKGTDGRLNLTYWGTDTMGSWDAHASKNASPMRRYFSFQKLSNNEIKEW